MSRPLTRLPALENANYVVGAFSEILPCYNPGDFNLGETQCQKQEIPL
jgi:hypothetical protein